MKKIVSTITLVIVILLLISLSGCAKLVNTEYETVQVEIVDEYHRGAYTTPIRVGKVTTFQHHPAVYRIYVNYNDVKHTISGSDTWYKYKDAIGETVPATLEIRTYDDGTVKHNITALEE